MSGILYVVATPIGNLEDITVRAARILREVDRIACEDTRVTVKLLRSLDVSKPLLAVPEHADARRIETVIRAVEAGESIAYVCDAGTPGMNDPGGKVVEAAYAAGIRVVPLPGASALTTAISACGFPMDEFCYDGFIPHKKGRVTLLQTIAERTAATLFLESTHRILKTLDGLAAVLAPERGVWIGRELTKLHETMYRGTIDEVRKKLQDTSTKGEFIVIIAPKNFHVS